MLYLKLQLYIDVTFYASTGQVCVY